MRWIINYALIASIAVLSTAQETDTRPKRDLSLLKDLLTGNIFNKHEDPPVFQDRLKIYKVQGLNHVLVKAVPKVNVAVEKVDVPPVKVDETVIVHEDPRISIVSSYLGTKSLNETLVALQNIKKLLQSAGFHAESVVETVGSSILSENTNTGSGQAGGYVPLSHSAVSLPHQTKNLYNQENYESVLSYGGHKTQIKEHGLPTHLEAGNIVGRIPQISLSQPFTYEMPQVFVNPYKPLKIAQVPIVEDHYFLKNDHSNKYHTHGGIWVDEQFNSKDVVFTEGQPQPLPRYIAQRIQNVAATAYRLKRPTTTVIKNGVFDPYGRLDKAEVPFGYSYSTIHKDGSVTSHIDTGIVRQSVGFGANQIHKNEYDNKAVVVQKVENPHPLPSFITDRFEKVASIATDAKTQHNIGLEETVYVTPSTILQNPMLIEMPQVNVAVDYGQIPSGYSYTTIHKDGSATSHLDSGVVKHSGANYYQNTDEHVKNIVVQNVTKPVPLPNFISDRIEKVSSIAANFKTPLPVAVEETVYVTSRPIYEKVNSVSVQSPTKEYIDRNSENNHTATVRSHYSYSTIHKDGSVTSHIDSVPVQYYVNENKIQETDYDKNIVVQNVNKPLPLPDFISDRIEKVASIATDVKTPSAIAIGETVYATPASIYEEVYPVVSPSKEEVVTVNDQVKNYNDYKVQSQNCYTTVHDNTATSFIDIPSSVTETPMLDRNEDSLDAPQKVVITKPIVSEYSYKQINHNMPNKFTVVKVGNPGNFNGFVKLNSEPEVSVKPDYVYIPPTANRKSNENVNTKTESNFSYKYVKNNDYPTQSDTNVLTANGVLPMKDQGNVLLAEPVSATSDTTTSDNSLSTNPIVVLQDRSSFPDTFPDGFSDTTPVEDSKKEKSFHRGDIPDMVF